MFASISSIPGYIQRSQQNLCTESLLSKFTAPWDILQPRSRVAFAGAAVGVGESDSTAAAVGEVVEDAAAVVLTIPFTLVTLIILITTPTPSTNSD